MPSEWTQTAIVLAALILTIGLVVGCGSEPDPASAPTPKSTVFQSPLGGEYKEPSPGWESNYGGLSLGPNDNSIVNVYMVNPSQEEAEALAQRHLGPDRWGQIREVRAIEVKYSKNQLDSWFRMISDDPGVWELPELTSMGVSIGEDHVAVGVACGAALERVEHSIRERMVPHKIPQEAVIFEVSGREILPSKPASPYTYECLPEEVLDLATGLSSPGFGGMYIEHDTINVFLLQPSRRRAEELALAYYGRKIVEETGDVHAVRGQYTWDQLQGWWRLIRQRRGEIPGVFPCNVDPKRNRITIEVRRSANMNVVEEVEKWLSELRMPKEAVILLDGE